MEARWLRLTVRGHNFVVAGMLRDRYFELALEKLDQMCADGVAVLPWLYDLATYMLLDIAEVDEAYQLALRRTRSGGVMSKALWSHLLDCSAKHLHVRRVHVPIASNSLLTTARPRRPRSFGRPRSSTRTSSRHPTRACRCSGSPHPRATCAWRPTSSVC